MDARQLQNAIDFGRRLIETGDLDPVYNMLDNQRAMGQMELSRWCLAYWMFYHPGVASKVTEMYDYWGALKDSLQTEPRGTERRHFRGQKALDAIDWFERSGVRPAIRVNNTFYGRTMFTEIRDKVMEWPQFGPWIAFKVADMGERVLGHAVDFSDCELFMYRDPVKGAALIYHGDQKHPITKDEMREVLEALRHGLRDLSAPPTGDRVLNLQEFETVLCKYKSHYNGHYPVGKDTREILNMLKGYGVIADCLTEALETAPGVVYAQ